MSNRERITITIRSDLLRSLDQTIDHQHIRNRSHAFEVALSRLLPSNTTQAVILASGPGTHMRPFSYEIPKPLIPVNGRPLLEYTIALLREHGITDIIITVCHLADKIIEHFGDGKKFGVRIRYVREKQPTGTGGALWAVQKKVGGGPFVIIYGDILLDLDIAEFLQAHKNNKPAIGTLALTSVADPSTYGAVKMRGTRIVEFSEKPVIDSEVSRLIFAGIGVFTNAVFNFFPRPKPATMSLEQDVFPQLIAEGRLYGYPFEGQWFDVSTPEAYERVLKQWQRE